MKALTMSAVQLFNEKMQRHKLDFKTCRHRTRLTYFYENEKLKFLNLRKNSIINSWKDELPVPEEL